MIKRSPVSRKEPEKKKFGPIIAIAIVFSIYGFIQVSRTTHEDSYIVVFAWTMFAIVWAAIAIIRYFNLQGKC